MWYEKSDKNTESISCYQGNMSVEESYEKSFNFKIMK